MFKNILKGLTSYKHSLKLINELKLWKFFLIPMAISFLLGTAIFFAAYGLSDNLGRFFAEAWVWEWGKDTFINIATGLGGLVILLLGFIVYKHTVMALSAPFMSPVSERIEKHFYPEARNQAPHRNTTNIEQLWRGLRITLRNITYELTLTIPLLLLSFIPVVGIFFTILACIIQAYYAGFGNIDYTLERHFKYKESIHFVKRRRGIAIGIGIVFMGMLFIPVIGIILVLPLSATAASCVTLEEIIKEENINLPHPDRQQVHPKINTL
jgi:CysZ protein